MKRIVALMLACAASCTVSMATEPAQLPPPGFHILRDGNDVVYHGGEAPLHPGSGWFALDVVGGLWHLRPASLRGEQARDEITGGDDGVSLHADPAGAFLYLRLPGLVAGKVDTPELRFKDEARVLDDSTALALTFKGRPWRLDVHNHEIFATDGATTTSLGAASSPDSGSDSVDLIWAGDLDRDGRLDFILEANGNNDGTICVWLSSSAKPGDLVGQAACWRTTGC